jgi:hypothetical protein
MFTGFLNSTWLKLKFIFVYSIAKILSKIVWPNKSLSRARGKEIISKMRKRFFQKALPKVGEITITSVGA